MSLILVDDNIVPHAPYLSSLPILNVKTECYTPLNLINFVFPGIVIVKVFVRILNSI